MSFFLGWIEMQTHRADLVGDLARFAAKDPELAAQRSRRDWKDRIRLCLDRYHAQLGEGAPPPKDYQAALVEAWAECQAGRLKCFNCGRKRTPRKNPGSPLDLCAPCRTARRKARSGNQ